ncbi:MAG TPA: hypothetical protein VIK53_17945 [Verrucomicrobiae bacterium]
MKTSAKTYYLIALALAAVQPAFGGAAKNPPVLPSAPVRSVFPMPANAQEGRDPFFPESPRPYADLTPAIHAAVVVVADLKVKGYFHDATMTLVTINNHTFAVGDEADLPTAGGRVHVRCVEIRPDTVVIDVNGHRQELHF